MAIAIVKVQGEQGVSYYPTVSDFHIANSLCRLAFPVKA
jgi:hypothetical protein